MLKISSTCFRIELKDSGEGVVVELVELLILPDVVGGAVEAGVKAEKKE